MDQIPDSFVPRQNSDAQRAPSPEESLRHLAETADYVSRRALQIDEDVHNTEHLVQHLGVLSRQLRTLASNTSLEATRMRMGGPLAEIARQMRRISQQISESNEQLALALRAYTVTMGEMRQAATTLLRDAQTLQDAARTALPGSGRQGLSGGTSPAPLPSAILRDFGVLPSEAPPEDPTP
jgi:ABC-type transporter Mla subunit MlaD